MNRFITEFIGTFFLVVTIGCAVIGTEGAPAALAPLAIGSVLTALVYAGGHVSGAHYNPAVTFAMLLRGKSPAKDFLPYSVAQCLGAATAACTVMYLKGNDLMASVPAINVAGKLPQILLAEFLFTFALCFVIFNVACSKSTEGNSYYGLAIGLVVAAGAFAVGDLSGAVFNPAVAIGISLLQISAWPNLWIYLVANFAAAGAAAAVHALFHQESV